MSALDFIDKHLLSPRMGMVIPGVFMVALNIWFNYDVLYKYDFPIYNITDKNVGVLVESDKLTAKLTDFDIPTRKLVKGKTRMISFKCEKVNCGLNRNGEHILLNINYIISDKTTPLLSRGSWEYDYYLINMCINNKCLTNYSEGFIQELKEKHINKAVLEIVFWFVVTIASFFYPIPTKDKSYEINDILSKYKMKD